MPSPHRVHELEEMVKDQETMAEQALEEEARRHREAYSKLEREKSTEIELLNTRWAPAPSGLARGTGPPPESSALRHALQSPCRPGAGTIPIMEMGTQSLKGGFLF